jgi:hypothetical protein
LEGGGVAGRSRICDAAALCPPIRIPSATNLSRAIDSRMTQYCAIVPIAVCIDASLHARAERDP